VESLLGEAEVSSLETRVPVPKGRSFRYARLIAIKFLEEILEAVSLGVNVESILGEAEVSALETSVPVRKGITFDPTVGSPSNFYRSFRRLFLLE
jgi:hypothetical protein